MLKDSTLLHREAFINNEWLPADSGKTFPVTNPATGDELARVADCAAAETQRAILAAEAALPEWRAKTATA
ncbi:MAG: aldehyde dehydrogenase family protein, partial [Saprospiraceae bacterium]|nr:aldehyde dehydrogenase family protein [Saprospiraceae bacterium]